MELSPPGLETQAEASAAGGGTSSTPRRVDLEVAVAQLVSAFM